ncbi:MAG: FdhF/YdeP family oxidoreductase [Deltaproteobacteria bacterium]|nr:FdhF/YdeP family oxidoreductase [Deltaproteobacteria bacterium]MDQ3298281.1 FdhF/YdeP family oxidoreductase [Myxococcota bacterium]
MDRDDTPRPDTKVADIELREVPRVAGGLAALAATTRHLVRDGAVRRGSKALLAMNQPEGFDCPGCAWPEPAAAHRSKLEFCENGAKAMAEETTTVHATAEVFAALSIDELRLLSDFELGQLGRLTEPVIFDPAAGAPGRHYRPISWDAAIGLLADEVRRAGPGRSVFYTSGRTSNEAAFLYQLVGRLFGTNNFPDCSNMCHDSSGIALSEVVGVNKGSVSLVDFDHAELIFVVGQNPGTNHPRMLTTLREAAKRGATIVAVNPLREVGLTRFAHPQKPLDLMGGVELAKHFVQIQIGGDLAFFLGLGKAVIELDDAVSRERPAPADRPTAGKGDLADVIDLMFLAEYTDGFDAWRDHVRGLAWATLVEQSGVSEATMREIAGLYAGAKTVITCWAMGLTQHKHAVATIQEIVNLMLLRGNVGRPGAGLCPVRGHSNVQGDRTMGIYHLPRPAFLDALGEVFGFAPPRTPGLDTVATIHALERGEVGVFMALGGNFLSAAPDSDRTARGLERCALTASVSTKLNRTHLYPGTRALILPCLGRSELDVQASGPQFVTVEDSMSMVHRSQGVLAPASPELRSEPAIVAMLGQALLGDRVPWGELAADYDRIRDLIARVVSGFTDFNTRVRTPDGFQLPNVARDRTFSSIGGRARFTVSTPPDLTLPPGRLRLMTIRSHDQYNTTIYGLDDRYRGIHGERRVVFVNPLDLAELGLVERQVVDLVSEWQDGERIARAFIVVPFDLPRRCAASYFPEANALVPLDSVADRSNTPTSKSIVIRIQPA